MPFITRLNNNLELTSAGTLTASKNILAGIIANITNNITTTTIIKLKHDKKSNMFYFLLYDNWILTFYFFPTERNEVHLTVVLLRQSVQFAVFEGAVLAGVA